MTVTVTKGESVADYSDSSLFRLIDDLNVATRSNEPPVWYYDGIDIYQTQHSSYTFAMSVRQGLYSTYPVVPYAIVAVDSSGLILSYEFSQHDFIREQLSLLPLKAMRLLYSVLTRSRPVLPSNLKERSYAELNKKRSQFLALSAGISKGS